MRAFALVAALLALAQPAAAYFDPFICVVNAARAAHGVGPVGWSRDLQGVARWVASDMERTGLVSHFGSDGSNPLTRLASFQFINIGENLAGGQSTSAWAMDSFLGSPGHRATLLDPAFNCFGGARVGNWWAQEYAEKAGGCPVPTNCAAFGYARLRRRSGMPGTTIGETYRANLQTGVIYGAETDEDGYQGPDEAESFAPPTRPTRAISNPMHADRALAPSPSETKEISSTFLPSADA